MAGPLARDLLGELDDEPVGVEEVERTVSPRLVDRSGQDLDAEAVQPLRLHVNIVDEEGFFQILSLPAG